MHELRLNNIKKERHVIFFSILSGNSARVAKEFQEFFSKYFDVSNFNKLREKTNNNLFRPASCIRRKTRIARNAIRHNSNCHGHAYDSPSPAKVQKLKIQKEQSSSRHWTMHFRWEARQREREREFQPSLSLAIYAIHRSTRQLNDERAEINSDKGGGRKRGRNSEVTIRDTCANV